MKDVPTEITSNLESYPFAVRPLSANEGGGYLIEYPDIPGVMSDGDTPEQAISNGRDALRSAILTLQEFADPVPAPGTPTAASGQWRQRIPRTIHARLTERARQEGVSLNALVSTVIAEGLGIRQSKRR
jgi:antitoxin HicB